MDVFIKAVHEAGVYPETDHIHEAFIHDIGADGILHLQNNVTLNCEFSTWYLSRINFEWLDISNSYLEGYIRYFSDIGYWGGEKNGNI